MAGSKRTIRASEIGAFLYCQRAWWYQRKKTPTINTAELAGGQAFHHKHTSQTRGARALRTAAYVLLLLAIMLIILLLTARVG